MPCTCSKVYIIIGETNCRLRTRIKEDKDACETEKSAIAEHTWTNDHPINWTETDFMSEQDHGVKESLSIRTTPEDMRFNRDSGYELPDRWITTYKN